MAVTGEPQVNFLTTGDAKNLSNLYWFCFTLYKLHFNPMGRVLAWDGQQSPASTMHAVVTELLTIWGRELLGGLF